MQTIISFAPPSPPIASSYLQHIARLEGYSDIPLPVFEAIYRRTAWDQRLGIDDPDIPMHPAPTDIDPTYDLRRAIWQTQMLCQSSKDGLNTTWDALQDEESSAKQIERLGDWSLSEPSMTPEGLNVNPASTLEGLLGVSEAASLANCLERSGSDELEVGNCTFLLIYFTDDYPPVIRLPV